jgi:mRNA-degrading endonuclease RelE of RelBE toxin-antitoxin system
VKYSDQVVSALRSLHPDIGRDIRRAMRSLEAGKTCNTKPLRPPLDGFWRLRVGTYRFITVQNKSRGGAETQREYQERPKTKEVASHFVSEFPNF